MSASSAVWYRVVYRKRLGHWSSQRWETFDGKTRARQLKVHDSEEAGMRHVDWIARGWRY